MPFEIESPWRLSESLNVMALCGVGDGTILTPCTSNTGPSFSSLHVGHRQSLDNIERIAGIIVGGADLFKSSSSSRSMRASLAFILFRLGRETPSPDQFSRAQFSSPRFPMNAVVREMTAASA